MKKIIFILLTAMVLVGCTSPVMETTVSFTETHIQKTEEKVVPTYTLESTATLTPTVEPTPTHTSTTEPTPTYTPTPTKVKTLDLEVGPAIVVVSPDEDLQEFQNFLDDAVHKDYQFATFKNFTEVQRPLIIIFDNVKASEITENQVALIDIMSEYNVATFAGVLDVSYGDGARFVYNKTVMEDWEICVQAGGDILDLSSADFNEAQWSFGLFQADGSGRFYLEGFPKSNTPTSFPICWVPYNGKFTEAVPMVANDWNGFLNTNPLAAKAPLTIIVSSDSRDTYKGYIEIYPATWELNFENLPY